MTDCRKCAFYDPEMDEQRRSGEDIVIVGQETPDNHFCYSYTPMPEGYFEGKRDCPLFYERDK